MLNTLMIYSTTDGHTKNICNRIINISSNKNAIMIKPLDEAKNIDLTRFSKIIIGASIRYGKHSKDLYKFIDLNKDVLNQKQSIFFFSKCSSKKIRKKYT